MGGRQEGLGPGRCPPAGSGRGGGASRRLVTAGFAAGQWQRVGVSDGCSPGPQELNQRASYFAPGQERDQPFRAGTSF